MITVNSRGVARVVQILPPRKPPERTYPRPALHNRLGSGTITPNLWRVYERYTADKPVMGELDLSPWIDTGFSASGLDQANWIVLILKGQNPEYEYIVSK